MTQTFPEGVTKFEQMLVVIKANALSMITTIEGSEPVIMENRAPLTVDEAKAITGEDGIFRIVLAMPVSQFQVAVEEGEPFAELHETALDFGTTTASAYITIHATVENYHIIEFGTVLDEAIESSLNEPLDDLVEEYEPEDEPASVLYPESDRLTDNASQRLAVLAFLDYLSENGMYIAKARGYESNGDPRLTLVSESDDLLFMNSVGINQADLEDERRAMRKASR